jgi:ankyrin repeat protein
MNFKSYLKYLNKIDYPNQTESLLQVSTYVSYSPDEFQNDLLANLGVVGTADFVQRTFSKLGLMSSPGFKVMLNYDNGDYVHLIIHSIDIIQNDEDGELPFHVWINYSWGDSRLVWGENDDHLTLQDAYEEIGLGEIGEWDELMDSIQDDVKYEVYKQTEFMIHFDAQQ